MSLGSSAKTITQSRRRNSVKQFDQGEAACEAADMGPKGNASNI
jgi:hypothetical protein